MPEGLSFDQLWLQLQSVEELPAGDPDEGEYETRKLMLREAFDAIKGLGGDIEPLLYRFVLEQLGQICDIDAELLKLSIEKSGGGFGGSIQAKHWAVPLIAGSLGDYLVETGGPNSVQTGFSITREGRPIDFDLHLTLAYSGAELPNQKAARLQEERDKLQTENVELKERITALEAELKFLSGEAEDA